MRFSSILTVLLTVLLSAGCPPAPPETPDVPEPTSPVVETREWDEQLALLRSGRSTALEVYFDTVSAVQWRELEAVGPSLRKLDVTLEGVTPDEFARVAAALPELAQVRLGNSVDDAWLRELARLPKLRILNLPEGEFTDAGLLQLAGHPGVELLRFRSSQVTDAGLQVAQQLPALRFLHVIEVPITDAGLSALHGLTQLESFYVDGSQCTESGLADLLEKLPDLHLHWNQLHLPGDPKADPRGAAGDAE